MNPISRIVMLSLLGAPILCPPARADPIIDWNITALQTTAAAPFNPPLESRNLAIVHAAMFDAVNSISGDFHPYLVKRRAARAASPEAAAVAAAHRALVKLYPAQTTTLDAAYAQSIGLLADGPPRVEGIAVGEAVADEVLALRDADGANGALVAPYAPGAGAGLWAPTPPALRPALAPGWGQVVPFLLRRPSQFRPGPPPALTSRQYTDDWNEIRAVGSATSASRSPEQTALAQLWVATGPQNWNPIARQLATGRKLDLRRTARVLALLNLAGADAFIAAWDAKYVYNQWRPVTAIRAADADGNPATAADSGWTPLLATPPFPDYVAGHTTYAGAAEAVLERAFGRDPGVALELTSATAPGVVLRYRDVRAISAGVVDARVWGGIHWRTSCVEGRKLGQRIGRYAVEHFLGPAGASPSAAAAPRGP